MPTKETWETPQGGLCPKCRQNQLYANKQWNCLSRRDNRTYICNSCGELEFLEGIQA